MLIVSGNHDSAERLEFASEILDRQKIYIAGVPPMDQEEKMKQVEFEDEFGKIVFYLLPFVKPGYVRKVFGEGEEKDTYDGAVRGLIEREEINPGVRNVLVSHQFTLPAGRNRSEAIPKQSSVGGLEQVDVSCHGCI